MNMAAREGSVPMSRWIGIWLIAWGVAWGPSWAGAAGIRREAGGAAPGAPLPGMVAPERAPFGLAPVGLIEDLRPIGQLTTDVSSARGKLPKDYAASALSRVPPAPREPPAWTGVYWEAPATYHRPLYYENVNLERHGYSFGLAQPFISAGHFVGTTFILPYRLAAEPTRERIYTLGHQRPGNPVPFQLHWPPPSGLGGVAEAGVITGLIFLIP